MANDCCKDKNNLQEVDFTNDVKIYMCMVCKCKHYKFKAEGKAMKAKVS